jgi:hypothetical protein
MAFEIKVNKEADNPRKGPRREGQGQADEETGGLFVHHSQPSLDPSRFYL